MRRLVLAVLSGCIGPVYEAADDVPAMVSGPSGVVAPSEAVFLDVQRGATAYQLDENVDEIRIDLEACDHDRLQIWLPLGSAWFLTHPVAARYCEMWLGGEAENPNYDGRPAQYCLFDRASMLVVEKRGGGPLIVENMPWCVLLR